MTLYKQIKNTLLYASATEISGFEQFLDFEISYAERFCEFRLRFCIILKNGHFSFDWVVNDVSMMIFHEVIKFSAREKCNAYPN